MSVIDIDKGFKDVLKYLKDLSKKELKAGILSDAGTGDKTDVLISEYATFNEYGTDKIPPRSFMRSTFDEKHGEWEGMLDKALENIINGKSTNIDNQINLIGERMVSDIKEKISSNIPPENADSTKRRKMKKKTSSNTPIKNADSTESTRTLIDSGVMRNSINYEIGNK